MIAEPFILVQSFDETVPGTIRWIDFEESIKNLVGIWQPYADFERGILDGLAPEKALCVVGGVGFKLSVSRRCGTWGDTRQVEYTSEELIGYDYMDWHNNSESSRLLARARFLKAVCERENVEWLPIQTHDLGRCPVVVSDEKTAGQGGEWVQNEAEQRLNPQPIDVVKELVEHEPLLIANIANELGAVENPDEGHCEQCCYGDCGCPCHGATQQAQRDTYTREEIDEMFRSHKATARIAAHMRAHNEREWREAILNLLQSIVDTVNRAKPARGGLIVFWDDLRRRFVWSGKDNEPLKG